MNTYQGKAVSEGIAMGVIHVSPAKALFAESKKTKDVEQEIHRFEVAKEACLNELNALYEMAVNEVGEAEAELFLTHAQILDDIEYNSCVYEQITANMENCAYAVSVTGEKLAEMFCQMKDEYFSQRAIDVKDITERMLRILGFGEERHKLVSPCLLAAVELTPSETIQFDKQFLLGFVTEQGSETSHTAILAKAMSLPAVCGVRVTSEWEGSFAILDGNKGILIINPDEVTTRDYEQELAWQKENAKKLLVNLETESITKDGRRIPLFANIGNLCDLQEAINNGANGIGLFRTEFLILQENRVPTEEKQFLVYREAAKRMRGKEVVIRTFDIGADKQVVALDLPKEANPALGLRAIRLGLLHKELLYDQLRAIYRASSFGTLSILYPMITSVAEVEELLAISAQVREELEASGICLGTVRQGIMIETPAAVLISDLLAEKVDFFSIGTNDLTQYMLAIDRSNSVLSRFYDPHHEAVYRAISQTVTNAHRRGIPVTICGELAVDKEALERLISSEVDCLSCVPSRLLALKQAILDTDICNSVLMRP